MSATSSRVPAGIPQGGQFAAGQRPEANVSLRPRAGQDPRVRGARTGQTNRLGIGLGQVVFSKHFIDQAKAKGFSPDQVRGALEQPYKVTDVTRYPGQKRYCGSGIAVVIDSETQHAITTYLDGVRTALRPDQMDDPHAVYSPRLNGHTVYSAGYTSSSSGYGR